MPLEAQSSRKVAVLGSALVALACESAASRTCSSEYTTAQQRVLGVDAKSKDSVKASLAAVESALAACRAAQRHGEVDHLVKAKNELGAQVDALARRAARKARKNPSPEELELLAKEGDPACPRGQSYRHEGTKEIKCTGPQIVEMTRALAREYFEERGYRTRDVPPATLSVEKGAEEYTFVYASADAKALPSCAVLVPPPRMPWEEAIARATGKGPARLEPKGTLDLAQGSLPYEVDEKNVVVRIGACPQPEKPAP